MITYNSSSFLERVLKGVGDLDYPKSKLRLVFVDNKSQDQTLRILEAFKEANSTQHAGILVVERGIHDGADVGEGVAICMENAQGEYYVHMDHDALVKPETFRVMLRHFQAHPEVGSVQFLQQEPVYHSRLLNVLVGMYVSKEPQHPYYNWTGGMHCAGFPMKLVRMLGYRRELGWGADQDFHERLGKLGYKILDDPTCRAEHLKPLDLGGKGTSIFIGQLRYLFWTLPRIHVPRIFIYHSYGRRQYLRLLAYWSLILGLILLVWSPWPLILFLGGLMLYEALKASGWYRLINPIVYPFFGFVYGCGMIRQLFSALILRRRSDFQMGRY